MSGAQADLGSFADRLGLCHDDQELDQLKNSSFPNKALRSTVPHARFAFAMKAWRNDSCCASS